MLETDPTIVESTDTERLSHCGSYYCPDALNNSVNLATEITKPQLYTMSSIYLLCALAASAVVLLLLDPLAKLAYF